MKLFVPPRKWYRVTFVLLGLVSLLFLAQIPASTDSPNSTFLSDGTEIQLTDSTYRLRLVNGELSSPIEKQTSIKLRETSFDPLDSRDVRINEPDVVSNRQANAKIAWIVQFETMPLDRYRTEIKALGGEIYSYLPEQSHIVMMDAQARDAVEALNYVRWVGPYRAEYKLDVGLEIDLYRSTQDSTSSIERYSILLLGKGEDQQNTITQFINSIGGTVHLTALEGQRIEASRTDAELTELAKEPQVLFVDRWSEPEPDIHNARIASGANYVESVGGYTGQGVRGHVIDSGLLTSHQDFQARPPIVINNNIDDFHGTNVYGIVFGDGSGNPQARGFIPDAQGIFSSYENINDRLALTNQVVDPNGQYRASFQTNSWGNIRTSAYTTLSAEMDDIIFKTDLLTLQSMSNAGSQQARPEAWAKNIVSIGAYNHYDTASTSDDRWQNSGSIGPAADGRIKPDLAFYYDSTLSTNDNGGYNQDFGGTSGATPTTAGNFGIFFQMWADGVFEGTTGLNRDVFDVRPHASTAKAIMINTANQHPFNGNNADMTRMHQGWGTASVKNAFDMAQNGQMPIIINETEVLSPLQTHTYTQAITDACPMRATMTYTDPAGNPSSSVHRVNDLNLKLTAPNGTVYWGNNGLTASMWSTSGGSANTKDTVENVFIQSPQTGNWTIQVIGQSIVQDGHVETSATDADYALVVTANCGNNTEPTPQPTPTSEPPATGNTYCASPNLAIQDSNTVSADLNINQTGSITDLDVSLDITHTWTGDVTVKLRNTSSNRVVTLVDRPGHPASNYGCQEDNINATFDDASGTVAENTCNSGLALSGTLNPEGTLADFNGDALAATWRLEVSDAYNGDQGTVQEFCVIAETNAPAPTNTPIPPTATPLPTDTPVPPTATPLPTSTPIPPTPTPIPPTPTPLPGPVCNTYSSNDIPKPLPNGTASVSSTLNVSGSGTITDLDFFANMDHEWVGDISMTLSHNGTSVKVFDRPGNPSSSWGCNGDNIVMQLDDEATGGSVENQCANANPTINGAFLPNTALSAFDGINADGTWTLSVDDAYTSADDGTLNSWNLQICTSGENPIDSPAPLVEPDAVPQEDASPQREESVPTAVQLQGQDTRNPSDALFLALSLLLTLIAGLSVVRRVRRI